LEGDLTYHLRSETGPDHSGEWSLRTNLMLTPGEVPEGHPPRLVFQIVAFSPTGMTLRRITMNEPSLPFTLVRAARDDD
jgi:hypothetical protein